jgi:hydroxypyruvate isomerase
MNRRTFHPIACCRRPGRRASSPHSRLIPDPPPRPEGPTLFPLSVMLWTVFTDLPFEERLAKVAEAGYTNIELVGEYRDWSDADFARANAARKRLGIASTPPPASHTASPIPHPATPSSPS